MPNTEQSIQETGGIPQIEVSLEVSGMTMTPVDKTLSVDNMAADSKTVGDAINALTEDIADINSDISGILAWNGTQIPITGDTGAESVAEAVGAANSAINTIMAWTGENVPITGATGATSIAGAMNAANSAISAIHAWTGSDIPINGTTGAESIASEVFNLEMSVTALRARTGANILYGITGETGADETIKEHVDALATGIVRSVNNVTADPDGNVPINKVPLADNIDSSQKRQVSGDFIIRTTGGDASISNGPANLLRISGNSVHTGFTPESLDFAVNSDSCEANITDMDTFRTAMGDSGTLTLTYTSDWSTSPATYGITVTGTPENGDSIVAVWVKEIRGTITNATPTGFSATGWNLYNQTAGYARVVKYSDDYGYGISGSYTKLEYSATETGTKTDITPATGVILFTVPGDGYVWVTGGGSNTAIWPTWSDWTAGYQGDFVAYNKTTIDLTNVMDACFLNGLCSVGNVRDYIDVAGAKAYKWIEVLEYNSTNLTTAENSGRPYDYDEYFIYLVQASATITDLTGNLAIASGYTANDHGFELFEGTTVQAGCIVSYGLDLRNRLEREVLSISQQTLTDAQKAQVQDNIGAISAVNINGRLSSMFKFVYYTKAYTNLANNTSLAITASDFKVATPSGYRVLCLARFTSGSQHVQVGYVNPFATGTSGMMGIRNESGSVQSRTAGIGIIYVKTEFM